MKKMIYGMVLLLGVILIGCEGPEGPMGPPGIPEGFIKNISIDWDEWNEDTDNTGPYLYYEIEEPRLTRNVLNQAIMETYYCYRLDENDETRYVPLAYSDFWRTREEYFTVEYSVGLITIMYKNDDASEGPYYDTYDFETRVIW